MIMRRLLLLLLLMAVLPWESMAAGRDTYTVIISLDGLRWDYLDTYDVPFMQQLAREGVKAVMQPSFPSKTFPNHYTLATGLTPDHHGIIANTFWDREKGVEFSLRFFFVEFELFDGNVFVFLKTRVFVDWNVV